ncbi:Signal recognition particle SRP9 subunit [Penicillium chermesinum]|nr:Signal recognition particle SRP9 subunit [Penicillium chermesinum]
MPYLSTSQAFLEQSAQLLQAYPDSVRAKALQTPTAHPATRNPPHRHNAMIPHSKPVFRSASRKALEQTTRKLPPRTLPPISASSQRPIPPGAEANKTQTLITTKYHFPTTTRAAQHKLQKSLAKSRKPAPEEIPAPVAALVLKTYNPSTGITLHYRTNKQQEVGRIITTLGKLAAGADVAGLGLGAPGAPAGDVEMVDAGAEEVPAAPAQAQAGKQQQQQRWEREEEGWEREAVDWVLLDLMLAKKGLL